jgi:putative tryptophan/tyrosine transport system substrate-binding protein
MRRIAGRLLILAVLTLSGWWPSLGLAQNKLPRIGLLTVAEESGEGLERYILALSKHGLIVGKNVTLEMRNGGGDPRRMTEPAVGIVQLGVDVVFAVGPPSVRAAVAATRDTPIVAHDLETDPVVAGYARTYTRPGANVTGLFLDSPDLSTKWLELLRTMVPKLSRVVVLWDTTSGPVPLKAVRDVAPRFGIKLQVLEIHTPQEIDGADSLFRGRPQAMIVLPSPMMYYESPRLAKLAEKQRLPATSMFVAFAEAGGTLAYGPDLPATLDPCADLIAKVLAGAKPGDLPIQRPTKFDFVFNLKTAKSLGVTIPDEILVRGDRVIR